METDLSEIKNEEARCFLEQFLADRAINYEFYQKVPDDKLDYRMVDNDKRKSDSPRESLAHQIYVTRKYIYGVSTGRLEFDGITFRNLARIETMHKEELLAEMNKTNKELVKLLAGDGIVNKKIKVPWSKQPIRAIQALEGLESHEILHTGWNLAIMDHLNIERFSKLKEMWG